MHGTRAGDDIRVAGGRERLHDARGYGRPAGDDVELAPVEAAYLLRRGTLDAVDGDGDRAFVGRVPGAMLRAYIDLRERGFRLRPARYAASPGPADLVVYERGEDPGGSVRLRLRVADAAASIAPEAIAALAGAEGGALAIADGEGEVSYFDVDRPDPAGDVSVDLPTGVPATLLDDRVLAWDPPDRLHDRGFYGQPETDGDGRDRDGESADRLHLSLVEAAALAERGAIGVEGGPSAITARGRDRSGDAFDRRLAVYTTLRDRGLAPRSGFKFGADVRTYATVASADDPGHSDDLVWVRCAGDAWDPRDLALRVRLAGGVRKRAVFAPTDASGTVEWIALERLTP